MMGGMGGGSGRRRRKSKAEIAREAKEERERRSAGSSRARLVGGRRRQGGPKAEAEDKEEGGPFKEITKGYRWVAITGTLDHGQMLANYTRGPQEPRRRPPAIPVGSTSSGGPSRIGRHLVGLAEG